MCLHCIRASRDFLYGFWTTVRGKAIQRPPVASVRRPRGDGTVTVRSSCSFGQEPTIIVRFFWLNVHLKSNVRTISARPQCGAHGGSCDAIYVYTGYGLAILFLNLS